MSEPLFPKMLNYQALKEEFGEETEIKTYTSKVADDDVVNFSEEPKKTGLTGSRLRSYAFAVLTRKEYSKSELIEKLCLYAEHREEVMDLVEELARENYQSDQRVAEIMLSSQKRKGKGPNQIKLKLKNKKIDTALIADELKEIDWLQQAYELKVKKYGTEVSKDPKIRAKQIRFLMYRGFEMDVILKAISKRENEE